MKAGVVQFPGSNCQQDTLLTLRAVGAETHSIWHKDTAFSFSPDLIVLPGGFSWGDYLRPGALAAGAPILRAVAEFAAAGGYVIGICNGFQILCEAGLLPGALTVNTHMQFICRPQFVSVNRHACPLLQNIPADVVNFPVAHRDGNYFASPDTLRALQDNNQIAFRYTDATGNPVAAANPNGSPENIAGVVSAKRNVLGLMPHPERAIDAVKRTFDTEGFWHSALSLFDS